MKLVCWTEAIPARRHMVFLFGSGLIGAAIQQALIRNAPDAQKELFPYDWNDPVVRSQQTDDLLAAATTWARASGSRDIPLQCDVIWAAGRGGFASDSAQMQVETDLFSEVLDLARTLEARFSDAEHGQHLFSSAGGLFEGQNFISATSQPNPLRPYGEGKLAQEALLQAGGGHTRSRIYRPSSVYGASPGARLGLIGTLIVNGLAGRTTSIFGRPDTLRDYVFADDIGRFVQHQISAPEPEPAKTFLLASGRPSPMFEIIARVEDILQSPLLLRYDTSPTNALHMSFRPATQPSGWRQTAQETGIRLTEQRLRAAVLGTL
ncbi:MAG: NAD-dependent epimerase/dehydratase family protein [Pseudomonadota bacterium]